MKRLRLELTRDRARYVRSPSEALPSFIRRYAQKFPYVRLFANHCTALLDLPFSVYIYAENNGISLRPFALIDIHIDDEFFNHVSIFHDWTNNFTGFEIVDTIKIKINGIFVGHYLPKHKILLLTDFTHKYDNLKYAYKALKAIVKVLGIDSNWPNYKIEKKTKNPKVKIDITLGCDPEFMIRRNTWVRARDVYDSLENPIGCDGAGTQLELRPDPSSNPRIVISNIKRLLKRVRNDGFDVQIADEAPLGGHIHVGFKFGTKVKPVTPSYPLLTAYDDFLGKRTNKLCYREGYGELSNFETKDWGFEYRTPSAAIFAHPEIARISMKIIKNLTKLATKGKQIEYNDPPTEEDYVRVAKLTKKEAAMFLEFVNNPPKPPYSILQFWKLKLNNTRRKKTFPLEIIFTDEWNHKIANKVADWAKTLRLKKPVKLVLFGLREDRGKVTSGIRVKGYKRISHTYTENDKRKVGIAWHLRQNLDDVAKIFKPLRRYIKINFGG